MCCEFPNDTLKNTINLQSTVISSVENHNSRDWIYVYIFLSI